MAKEIPRVTVFLITDKDFFLVGINFRLQIQKRAPRRMNFHYRDRSLGISAENLSLQIQILSEIPINFHYTYRFRAQNELILQSFWLQRSLGALPRRTSVSHAKEVVFWKGCLKRNSPKDVDLEGKGKKRRTQNQNDCSLDVVTISAPTVCTNP